MYSGVHDYRDPLLWEGSGHSVGGSLVPLLGDSATLQGYVLTARLV